MWLIKIHKVKSRSSQCSDAVRIALNSISDLDVSGVLYYKLYYGKNNQLKK